MWAFAAGGTPSRGDARTSRGMLRLVKQLLVVRLIFELATRWRRRRLPTSSAHRPGASSCAIPSRPSRPQRLLLLQHLALRASHRSGAFPASRTKRRSEVEVTCQLCPIPEHTPIPAPRSG
eukprot:CAMPEP_0119408446 /NCGR_PEP_ID=MMETSP1335-20130426/1994_1 /TAXON_ID=259385 /ORGANISM="Chrysoculter rhomboideus, Strain RCC1486" /LENGTH=120 /DNA_ID=CAMNT_0007432685 /DNA_START=76 /DNA_END=438 /DNA_ORIENTATION=-